MPTVRDRRLTARGIPANVARAWRGRKFLGTGASRGFLKRNGFKVMSRNPSGTQPTLAVVVAGTSTPLSVGVVGSAITVNSATSAGGAATTTSKQAVEAIRASAAASALVWAYVEEHSTGDEVLTAAAAASLVPEQP